MMAPARATWPRNPRPAWPCWRASPTCRSRCVPRSSCAITPISRSRRSRRPSAKAPTRSRRSSRPGSTACASTWPTRSAPASGRRTMHDSQLEEQLRGVLRAEGDGIPLTITTVELERRLATRRRTTGGRRLSLVAAAVAAIAVVSIVAAGNGWLKLPAIGTVASPHPSSSPSPTAERSAVPSFKPVPGVVRIEPPVGSTVLHEVLPTTFAAVDVGSFDADLPAEQYDVTVQILCIGSNMTLTEGSREWPIGCYSAADENPLPASLVIPVVDGHLALRWTAEPNVGYTILVTTSALPVSLPALPPFDETTATMIDASSPFDRPVTGGTGTLVTQPIGILPNAPDYAITLVCL